MHLTNILKTLAVDDSVYAKAYYITPQAASELLLLNTKNRKLQPGVVDKYAHEIRSQSWTLTPQGIGFDEHGQLVDGQHRLSAIIKSREVVPVLVVTNLPDNSRSKTDRGLKRSTFDVMKLANIASSRDEVAITTAIIRAYNTSGKIVSGKNGTIPDSRVAEMLELYKQDIDAVLAVCKSRSRWTHLKSAVLGAFVVAHSEIGSLVIPFVEQYASMKWPEDNASPIKRLYEAMVDPSHSFKHSNDPSHRFRKTYYAIDAWARGLPTPKMHSLSDPDWSEIKTLLERRQK